MNHFKKSYTHLLMFPHQNLEQFPILTALVSNMCNYISHLFNLSPTYNNGIRLSVCQDSSPKSFPPQIRDADMELYINPCKFVAGNNKIKLCCCILPHVHFTQRDFLCSCQTVYVCSLHLVEPLSLNIWLVWLLHKKPAHKVRCP
jgi:hypothetical protein